MTNAFSAAVLLFSTVTLLIAETTFEEAAPPERPAAAFWFEVDKAESNIKARPDSSTYGDSVLYLTTENAPDSDGYYATFTFTTKKSAEYTFWVACGKLGGKSVSPMHFFLDTNELEVSKPVVTGSKSWSVARIIRWNCLGKFRVAAGKHTLKILVNEPRPSDSEYNFFLDSVAIIEGGER